MVFKPPAPWCFVSAATAAPGSTAVGVQAQEAVSIRVNPCAHTRCARGGPRPTGQCLAWAPEQTVTLLLVFSVGLSLFSFSVLFLVNTKG